MPTRSRKTDPATSREAGERVTNLRASQARVLNMFVLYGDMHDQQLAEYLRDAERTAGLPPMSSSGVRSRRSELCKPNMDRLDALAAEAHDISMTEGAFSLLSPVQQQPCRDRLRREGFRSKLWDTGKREVVNGRRVTVWGLAR